METKREFLDTCALNNNAVRPNVSRQVLSTPNGIESIPSAAVQASPYQSPFNFEYEEQVTLASYATVKSAQSVSPKSHRSRPPIVPKDLREAPTQIDVHSVSISGNDAVSVA